MDNICKLSFLILAASSLVSASENGGYYVCDAAKLVSDNKCIFAFSGSQPEDWGTEPVLHDIDITVGDDFYRGVHSITYGMLPVSPKPWVNGDTLVGTDPDMITGDEWSGYALIFELMAPLRDMMMYNPAALDETTWKKWTRALTDCNAKTEDYVQRSGGGTPFSTDQVYGYMTNPGGTDIHHFILQYLEEGTMDLVCLSTDLEMEHCDVIRATAAATAGVDRCNCWFDAYEAIYGVCPVVDTTFTTCAGTTAPTVCAETDDAAEGGSDTDDEVPEVPDTEDEVPDTEDEVPEVPSPPAKPSGKPSGRR